MATPNNEILTGSPDEIIKVTSLEDFKRKINISELPEGDLKEYFSKPLEFTKSELQKLRADYLKGIPDHNSIKNFLVEKNNKAVELGKQAIDEIKQIEADFAKTHGILKQESNEGKNEGIEVENKFKEQLSEKVDTVQKVGGEVIKKAQIKAPEILNETKDAIEKGVDSIKSLGFVAVLEKMKEEGGFLGFLAGILLFLVNLGGFGDKENKLKDAKEGIEKKVVLSPEQITETRKTIKNLIIKWLAGEITLEIENKIDKSLENISKENLLLLYEKHKKGELNLSDISKLIPNLMENIITKEQIEKTKKDIQDALVEALEKEIREKYNIELDNNKLFKLRELIINNSNISPETIGLINNVKNSKELLLKDFFGPGMEAVINTTSLMLGLLINGIIPVSAFGMDFIKSGVDIIDMSIDSLGIGGSISMDTFTKSIEGMNPQEKAILIGLLYRKGGLFLSIVGSLTEFLGNAGIEWITRTEVKGYDLLKSSVLGNNLKQAENFEKIARALGNYQDQGNVLKDAINSLKKIQENYILLDTLEKSGGNTAKAISELEKFGISIPDKNPNIPFDDFVKSFKNNISNNITEVFSKESFLSKFGFGASADLYNLSLKMENITKAQRMMLNGNFLTNGIGKLRELREIGEISRFGDRMILHFESKEQALKGISKWNVLANKFPEIVKGCIDKLPIIAVAGLSMNSDEPLDEFVKEMKYLFPIFGPISLIGDSGLGWVDGKPKIINGVDAGIGGALLTLDGVFLTKELLSGGGKAGISYMIKPIKDIYSIGRGTAEGVYSVGKAVSGGKSIGLVFKEAIEKSKMLPNPKLRAFAFLGFAGYIGYKTMFGDDLLKDLEGENGKIDQEKLKKEIPNLDDDEKNDCLKYILIESFGDEYIKDIQFNIINNKLYIISNNDKIQEQFIVDDELLETLGLNPIADFTYNKKTA